MNLNEAIRAAVIGKKVTTGGTTPDSVTATPAKTEHKKDMENQLYRIDNAETESPSGDSLDEISSKLAVNYMSKANTQRRDIGKNNSNPILAKIYNKRLDGVDNADAKVEKAPRVKIHTKEVEALDEAQFILLKKGGTTKRIRNDPDEIARARAQGWVVVGTQTEEIETEEVVDEAILGGEKYKGKKNPNTKSDSVTLAQDMAILKNKKTVKEDAEELDEISKEKTSAYVIKALVSRAKAHKDSDAAQTKKNAVHDKDYESEDNFQDRKARLDKKRKGHEADQKKADKTATKRTVGLNKAGRILAKEETLDELSKRTLGSYIKRAHVSGLHHAAGAEISYQNDDHKLLKYANKKSENRESGINRAVNKLTRKISSNEEIETVDELSKGLLNRYIDAAAADSGDKLAHGKSKEYGKRIDGIDKAKDKKVKKLTKEELMDMSVEDAKAILEDAAKRGRPSKSDEKEHIIVGLRKSISLKGDHDVHFGDGSKHKVSSNHAVNILQKHDAFQKPSEKMAFAQRISASHDSLKKAVASVPKSEKPKEDSSSETKKPTKAITVKIDK